ncbi:hypothetical protein DFJ73DRAFT_473482 [Zopfochytrium polystomum]|nr:hypothetical protein DFJ73DRAFT_473482 [Zopfochytrium polystomum]
MQSHLHQFHQSLHPEPPPPQQQQQQQQQQHQQQQQQPQNHHHHTHQPPQLPYQHNDSSLQQHEQSLKLHLPVHQDHQDHYSQQQQQFHSHHSQFLLPHSTQQPQEHQPQQGQQSLSDHHFHHQLNQRQQPLHSHQPHQIQGQDHLLPQHQPGQHSPDRPQPQQLLQHRLQYSPRIGEQPAHQHYANSAITSSGAVAGGTMDVFHPATHSRPLQFSLSTDSNPDPFHPYPNTPFVAHAPPSTSSTSVVSSVNQLPARNSFPVASSALQSSPGETGTSYQSLGPTPRFHHQNDRQQQQEQQQQQQQQQPQQEQISLFPSVSQASQGGSSSNDAIWSYAGARPAPNEYSQGQVQSLDPSNSAVLLMSYSPHQQPQRAQQGQLPTALSISFDQTPEQTHFPGGSGPRNHSPSPASPSASPTEYTGPNAGSGADSFYGNRFLATDQDIPASGIGSLANSAGAAGDGANLAEDGGGLQPSGSQARSSSRSQITKRW